MQARWFMLVLGVVAVALPLTARAQQPFRIGRLNSGADSFFVGLFVAILVSKISRGAKPADLPIEQPTKFQLFINLITMADPGHRMRRRLLRVAGFRSS